MEATPSCEPGVSAARRMARQWPRPSWPLVRVFRVIAAMLSLATLTAGAGCARNNAYNDWSVNRSRNVALYTDAKLEHRFIQEWLELSHAAFQPFFPEVKTGTVDAVWLKVEPGSGTRIYRPWDDPRAGWTLETVPSGGKIGRHGLIILERELEFRGTHFAGVRNEQLAKAQMAHLFIMKAVPMAPLWVQIGLGRYMQKFRIHYQGKLWMACYGGVAFDEPLVASPAQLDPLGRMGQRGTVGVGDGRRATIDVEKLFTTDWYDYDGQGRRWFEYTAYALIHYLIHGDNGFNRSRFPLFLKALREGQSSEVALRTAYPQVLDDEWDERLAVHVRPSMSRAYRAGMSELPQGMCFQIPPAHHADKKPRREKADTDDIATLMSDLERVEPFRRHAGWWPQDIVHAEAAKRPGRQRGGPGLVPGRGGERTTPGAVPGGDRPASVPPADDDTPTLTAPGPAPSTTPAPAEPAPSTPPNEPALPPD